ncbi:MAG: T9SS type A sorting domain-containing protein [Ignavibacteriaceae bacterium]|nr:T9SS type A sorting domain-containing protein [Ignavibacteriaceae bacterium]
MKKKLILILLFVTVIVKPQTYPPAVEVWSEPVRIDSLAERFKGEDSPFLTNDMMNLYLFKSSVICKSYKIDTLWSLPIPLNNNVNNGNPIRNPSISVDKKRLYYCRWGGYGNWDLWYSKWDTLLNDWGPSINLGSNVNSTSTEWYAYELSEDTLYCINNLWASLGLCIYVRNAITNEWQIVDSSNYNHPFGAGNLRGLSVTGDRRKAYFSRYITLLSDSLQSELFVTYWDSVNNRWGNVFELNINSKAFKPDPNNNFYWIGGWDENPWISSNGKVMYFMSNRDAAREDTITIPDIYVSYQLIDENGNPVSLEELPDLKLILNDFILFQNYPNPFNSITNIRFYLPQNDDVSLTIYDILGKEVFRLISNQSMIAGWHEYLLNMDRSDKDSSALSSGVYLYTLKTSGGNRSKKMILLR